MRTIPMVALTGLILSASISMATFSIAAPLPAGSGEQRIELGDVRLTVFTYRPACRDPSLLLVFHGQNRNADDYRDWARPLADKQCLLVVAPRFGKAQFPGWRYQRGGIVRDRAVQAPREWTGRIAIELAEHIQQLEGRKMSYALIGHSAGGQFLSRLAAYTPAEAQRIVIANPGTHVLPDLNVNAPYGFGQHLCARRRRQAVAALSRHADHHLPRQGRHRRGRLEHEPARPGRKVHHATNAGSMHSSRHRLWRKRAAGPSTGASSRWRAWRTTHERCLRRPKPPPR